MAKPVITDKPVLDQAEFNGVTIWQKEGGSIEVSDTNYPSMKAAIKDIAARAGVTLQDDWNTQYSGRYLIQQLKGGKSEAEAEKKPAEVAPQKKVKSPNDEPKKIAETINAEKNASEKNEKIEVAESSVKLDDNKPKEANQIMEEPEGSFTISLKEPGTLQQYIMDNAIDMTALKLVTIHGNINRDDVKLLNMIRSSYNQLQCRLVIPEGPTEIPESAYYMMDSLFEVVIPDSVTSIGYQAFKNCKSLKSVILSKSLTSIGNDAFSGCTSLSSITIPKSVTSIGSDVFRYCSSLSSITIPDSVTSIGDNAFCYCDNLKSVILSKSLTSIEYEAFRGCTSLSSITIPKSLTKVGDYAFKDCSNLSTFRLLSPISTKEIGYRILDGCYELSFIEVPKGSMPFYQMSGWKDAKYGIHFIEFDPNAEMNFKDPFDKNMVTIKANTYKQKINDYHPGWTETFSDKRKKEILHPSWTGSNAGKARKVTISKDYKICKYLVTQGQWEFLMGNNPSHFSGDSNLPVENITWVEVNAFISRLNALTGKKYRLPSFAEWQMAGLSSCRDEDNCLYKFSEDDTDLKDYAWMSANSEGKTHPVGQLKPNENGLYDMQGNVKEFCRGSGYGNITSLIPVTDPVCTEDGHGSIKHICGSSYSSSSHTQFSIGTEFYDSKGCDIGFRLAETIK